MESLRQFLTDDHRRLDALLDRTGNCASAEELAAYDAFRRGILKHIGIEEKIMLTAAAKARGAPLEQAARLRLDHGAIVSLLMPTPTPAVIRAIRTILAQHNPIEEGDDGVYDLCDRLTAAAHEDLMATVAAAPEVPTNPNATTSRILDVARNAMRRAGYDPALLDD